MAITDPSSSQAFLFQDLAISLLTLIAALGIYFLLRIVLAKLSVSRQSPGGVFLRHSSCRPFFCWLSFS